MAKNPSEEPVYNTPSSPGNDSFYEVMDKSPEQESKTVKTEEDKAKEQEELMRELRKVEEEILTLQSVLSNKIHHANELKRKLGITPITEIKTDLKQGLQSIRESPTYQKTSDAFRSFGAFASKKLGDARNSTAFKSIEEKVGGAYASVRTKVSGPSGSVSAQNFQDMQDVKKDDEGQTTAKSMPTTPVAENAATTPTTK